MSGWIVPVKDGNTEYPLNSNTFYITTESVTGSRDGVYFSLYTDSGYITNIYWRFSDWGYIIAYCTPIDYSLKFLCNTTNWCLQDLGNNIYNRCKDQM